MATWAFEVVPSGMPLIGPDMSSEMRLCAISWEMAGSDRSEPLAVGLSGPLGFAGGSCGRYSRGCYGRVCRPSVEVHEVPAAKGGLLARGSRSGRGRLLGANVRCWALRGRL